MCQSMGLDPFPGDQWIHDVGFDGMRVVETSVEDALVLNCSRVAVVGEEPDGRWIQGGESLWKIAPPPEGGSVGNARRGAPSRRRSGLLRGGGR